MSESSKESGAGRVSFLREEQKQRIYETALGILADIGMVVLHEEGEQVMLGGGCTKDGDGNVHVPPALVEQARAKIAAWCNDVVAVEMAHRLRGALEADGFRLRAFVEARHAL